MNENQVQKVVNHVVTIENRKKIMLTGIEEVISSTDKMVIAKTQTLFINIIGSGLRIGKLNLEEKNLIVEGEINEFKYIIKNKTKNVFKRLIK